MKTASLRERVSSASCLVLLASVAATSSAVLDGCSPGAEFHEADGAVASTAPTFEEFLRHCDEREVGLVCEGDIIIERDRDPFEFWQSFIAPPPSFVESESLNGGSADVEAAVSALSRTRLQGDTNLTYCVRNVAPNGFTVAQAAVVRAALASAAALWSPHVTIRYQHVANEDTHCDGNNTRVDFHVRPMTSVEQTDTLKQFAAYAFFPGDSRSSRLIRVNTTAIPTSNTAGFTNLMVHELGHTLGFVHEQYREPTTGCRDAALEGTALTRYDASSVMHYPECNGAPVSNLSTYDRRGARCAYYGECEWQKMPGEALDIGVGANGSVWIIGTNRRPYRYDPSTSTWVQQPGTNGSRIAVNSTGSPWMVNTSGNIYRWVTGAWNQVSGSARDIAIGGPSNTVWIVGTNGRFYRWNGSSWNEKSAGSNGARIAVGSDGRPWIINSSQSIYVENGNGWLQLPGSGRDIAASANGSVWLIGSSVVDGGYSVHEFVPSSGGTSVPSWTRTTGGGVNIAVDPSGKPWLTNNAAFIYRNRWE